MGPKVIRSDFGHGVSGELGAVEFAVTHAVTVALPEPAIELSAARTTVCARTSRAVSCWGALPGGESGRTPTEVPLPGPARSVSVGPGRVCAVVSGAGYCWGDGMDGQLDGKTRSSPRPVPVPAL